MNFESMYWVRRCLPPIVFGISITICSGYLRPAYPSVVGLLLLIHVMKRFNPLLLIFLCFYSMCICVCVCVCVCVCYRGAAFLHVHLYFMLLPLKYHCIPIVHLFSILWHYFICCYINLISTLHYEVEIFVPFYYYYYYKHTKTENNAHKIYSGLKAWEHTPAHAWKILKHLVFLGTKF